MTEDDREDLWAAVKGAARELPGALLLGALLIGWAVLMLAM